MPSHFNTSSFGKYETNSDDTMETRWASMLEQRMENMVVTSEYTHYQLALFQENWQGYDTYSSQYSSEWWTQSNVPWGDYSQYSIYNYTPPVQISTPRCNLEDLVSKYLDLANNGVKRMEAIQRSQTTFFQNMKNQIEVVARIFVEKQLSNIPINTITLWDVEEQLMTFPIFMDDEDETAQELEESTSPRFQEPLLNTSVVEKKSWKQPKENDEERRRLMEFKGNFENIKREQSLCYEKSNAHTEDNVILCVRGLLF
ncbi:hypothetical protein M9H77_07077 [Catharanthus roseus]|uniref:Uncharacterized protein n=1 Tax=Catharanthus roseus TaxID=4058 RepID=A0ACC0BU56_CATRO|nr:hypothetical protein M9H77_07077 [Catharanthus roseus]